jgi:hypothetical protein
MLTVHMTLNAEEEALLTALAEERKLTVPADVLRALLHDAAALADARWDRAFASSQALLDQLADDAHAEYIAGRTEDFDPDTDPDRP